MSQFEYVSVAIALVFTLAVGRVLAGIQEAFASERRYLVHTGWVVHVLLTCVGEWWLLWRTSAVDWTAFRFLWVLALPTLQYLRAAVLLGDGESVASYHDHFYRVRRPYFALAAIISLHLAFTPWVLGVLPWLTPGAVHIGASVVGAVALVGLVSRSERVHGALVCVALGMISASFFAMSTVPDAG